MKKVNTITGETLLKIITGNGQGATTTSFNFLTYVNATDSRLYSADGSSGTAGTSPLYTVTGSSATKFISACPTGII